MVKSVRLTFQAENVLLIKHLQKWQTRRLATTKNRSIHKNFHKGEDDYALTVCEAFVQLDNTSVQYNGTLYTQIRVLYGADREVRYITVRPSEAKVSLMKEPKMNKEGDYVFKTSLLMPAIVARFILPLRDVKLQRLQDITKDDAIAEGMNPLKGCPIEQYKAVWQSIHSEKGERWEDNPEVVAYDFQLPAKWLPNYFTKEKLI